jgi:outer membrane lipoprotein carrier protein LolA
MSKIIFYFTGYISCLLIAQIAHAEGLTIQQIASHLSKESIIHADFDQTRKLAALTRPVKSTGKVVVAGKQGIIWQIDYPYSVKYVITMERVIEIDADGTRKPDSTGNGQPLQQTAKLIGSLMDLNDKILSENFTINTSGDINSWTIMLVPNPSLSRFIKIIKMQGSSFMETVQITDAQGDSIHLKFYHVRKDEPLSAEELKLIQGF